MKCWICGNEANTGEHRIKASDLKLVFRNISPEKPIFMHNDKRINRKIESVGSDRLKSLALICSKCNSELTQPYDIAWEKFSSFINCHYLVIHSGKKIYLHKIFPGSVTRSILYIHLYFVKLFGCVIIEKQIPIDIRPFSEAILSQTAHPNLFLAICPEILRNSIKLVGYTDLQTIQFQGQVVYAVWFYILDKICVRVVFSKPGQHRKGLIGTWHPSNIKKYLQIVDP